MQEVATEPVAGRRPAFAGVDLRRPKGYAAPPLPSAAVESQEGEPCPRCESRDTKFCYYNNYNTAQPRHFCKGCRRYWTKGGTLRNVPVGGGTRKKPSSSSSSSPSSAYAAAAKPKRPYKKKRRVAPPPEPAAVAPSPAAAASTAKTTTPTPTATTHSAKTTTTTTTPPTDAVSEITTELVVPAMATEDDALMTHLLQPDDPAVALGLGLSDFPCSGKGGALPLLEPDSFEWPASLDLGACWGPAGGFGDPVDPALFLNLP
ncbi:hypothetical protein PR202_ga21341 [Eleusine coracana subsp. coracana]|uniref:Dof zinc finger protein n=1 Tax=Eleusine coracana subsp. coracana TaxID=191504 RepID=A0AAV5CYW4_ELECO|nr:hypothetical protein QOZ80_8AG0635280 [Eleusine coracana subsp. coracana]GJN03853.1 hypothetical protein PR202_ga21341 [Eleusine coracana subsp. coracana]